MVFAEMCYAWPAVGAIRSLGAFSDWVEPIRPNRYTSFSFSQFEQNLYVHKI
jgi:hypothetical protein